MDPKYEYLIDDFKNNVHGFIVERLFEEATVKMPPIDNTRDSQDECAKAFLIWLAISAFGISLNSDIVLCHMGLLNGYSMIDGVIERRKKFFLDSNYYRFANSKRIQYSRQMSIEDISKKAKNFNKTDIPLLREMVDHFDSLEDKVNCFMEACERYLVITRSANKIRQVRLPDPSFVSKFDNPICFNLKLKNPLFSGREDTLGSIEDSLSSLYSRKVVILYGMGGVGKTQIALEYAHLHQHQYSTVVWLDASDFNTLNNRCCDFLLENSKYNDPKVLSDPEAVPIHFRKFMNKRANSLIIFDNADYIHCDDSEILDAQNKLMSYIPSGNVHVIVTTRNDRIFFGSDRIRVDVFSPELSVEYLANKTGVEANDYTHTLAERLGYLPLALDYVSGYIFTNKEFGISYKEYLDLWDTHGFAVFDQNDANYAEMTIRQAFDITLEKLKQSASFSYSLLLEMLRICAYFSTDYLRNV